MAIELKTIHENLLYIAKVSGVSGTLELLRRDLVTNTLTSDVLPASAIQILQGRLNALLEVVDASDRAAQTALMSGLLSANGGRDRMTVAIVDGSPDYVALTIGTLSDTHYIPIALPHSTQAPIMEDSREEAADDAVAIFGERFTQAIIPGSNTVMEAVNCGTIFQDGSRSAYTPIQVEGALYNSATSATLNALSRVVTQNVRITAKHKPQMAMLLRTGQGAEDLTNLRLYTGLLGSVDPSSSDAPAQNGLWFRYSTTAGDTTWKAVVSHFSAGAILVDTGVVVEPDTNYRFEIDFRTADAKFYINGTLVATISSASIIGQLLSGNNTLHFGTVLRTLEAVSKDIRLGAHIVEANMIGMPT